MTDSTKQQLASSQNKAQTLDQFSQEQFDAALTETLRWLLMNNDASPEADPKAFLLGGQSGAGKTTLHDICMQARLAELKEADVSRGQGK